ncbi:GDSL esterase/lipase [Rhynchospora pubera]|uniref:GDSL esterase/lipase n=1 Tax=Rhynchospora pubera TaxID=906938 RepID=A0AAV8D9W0_9POAL|nr:GDSL esterase/lipase [Rhynchospora pubera]
MKRTVHIILSFLFFLWPIQPTPSHAFDSIFSFGDSYTDTGNINVLAKKNSLSLFSDNLPYGMTFFQRPSKRFCDGRLIVDFLAEEFGLPFLKPYLDKNESFRQGANFAVAGATTLDKAFFKQHNITVFEDPLSNSLPSQLQWFEELKPSLCQTVNECTYYFGRSLFIVGQIEGNDYIVMFSSLLSVEQMMSYTSTIIQTIAGTIKELIDQGARTVVVPGNIPMGCLPSLLTILKNDDYSTYDNTTGCLRKYNELSRYHNSLLLEAIKELRIKYPLAKIIYADFYKPVINFIRFPQRYGFTSIPLFVCCGIGGEYNWNQPNLCGTLHVTACQNPSTHVNWDGQRLTEASYHYVANSWLKGPYADPPILDARPVMINAHSNLHFMPNLSAADCIFRGGSSCNFPLCYRKCYHSCFEAPPSECQKCYLNTPVCCCS